MNKISLLTAEPRTGKTTCIKKIIDEIGLGNCEGFYTEEIRENGERTGFDCVTLTGERVTLAYVNSNSNLRVSRYGVELDGLEQVIIPIIEQALLTNKVLIIDEIGPMELFSESFKAVLNKALSSDKVILGTIFFKPHNEVDVYKKHPNVNLIELTKQNRDIIPYEIANNLRRML